MLINMFFLVDMEEVEINEILESRPALGEAVRNWVIIAHEPNGTRVVVHALIGGQAVIDRLRLLPAYLGDAEDVEDAYRAVWDNHPIIAKHIIQCTWMEYDGEQAVLKRGTIVDWENAGSPIRVDSYTIPHKWAI